ncbi:MAG TPA: T9SS type A sorting domain-containing protein [Ignavibacteriaceae bacterium]|nr:T9SS type A sorting domain-containing protein [Ignavibacteriaceae bacterium]
MQKLLLIVLLTIIITALTSAQYLNVRVDGPSASQPEEVSIAINPTNPNFISAGANIDHFFRSTDAGLTWTTSFLSSSSYGVWGDPCVVYDELGYLYFGHLSNPPLNGYWIDRIVVQRSTNNGLTWNDGAGIGFLNPKNQDKEWIGVDMHSQPYKGNIYTTWTEFDDYGSGVVSDSSRIKFSRSTDKGLTWSTAITISDVSGNCIDEDNTVEGAVPCVGPNGEVYVSWAGPLGLLFDKSTNGGTTWGADVFVSTIPGGWDYSIPGISRANGLPITACDTSQSLFRGNIYINWSDQRNGTGNTDIFLSKSTDGGNTWSAVKKVNDDNTTRHQFFTWMTIDQTTGILYFVFYDRRNTSNNLTDVYMARSTDGGETFINFKVSQSSFNPNSGVFFGDYTNIAALNKTVYPIWTRLDGNALSVWTAIVNDSASSIPVELNSFAVNVNNGKVNLNWQTASELNNQGFEIQRASSLTTPRFDWRTIGFVNGKGTTTEFTNYSFVDEPIQSGNYSYRLKQIDYDGSYEYSNEVDINFIFANDFRLSQNYPNPFNPSTTIEYQIPQSTFVTIKVYDALGAEVVTLVNKEMPAGVHEVNFSAVETLHAASLPSGLYLYKISAGNFEQTRKMLLLK